MTDRFLWHRPNGDRVEGNLVAMRRALRANLKVGAGPFDATIDGEPLLADKSRTDALRRLLSILNRGDVGPVYRVFNGAGVLAFQVREVMAAPDVIDTSGNDKADAYWTWVVATFPQYEPRFAGAYVCKSIAGSGGVASQHSYGNAVDVFFDSMAHQQEVALAVVKNATELSARNVISGDRIWTSTSRRWSSYSGEYHSHLHVDFDPAQSGSCGVKP